MKHIYFVSFSHSKGMGCCEVITRLEIFRYKQIEDIIPKIEEEHNVKDVVIISYQLLRTE